MAAPFENFFVKTQDCVTTPQLRCASYYSIEKLMREVATFFPIKSSVRNTSV